MQVTVHWAGSVMQEFPSLGKAMQMIRDVFPRAFYRGWQVVEGQSILIVWEDEEDERFNRAPVAKVIRPR